MTTVDFEPLSVAVPLWEDPPGVFRVGKSRVLLEMVIGAFKRGEGRAMAIVCDTGGVYALYDADDSHHLVAREVIEAEPGPLFLPVVLLAEIDYLLTARLGVDAALDFLQSIEAGAFTLVELTADDLARCRELVGQCRDLPLGIADASVVAAAERLSIQRLLTVDERHSRATRPRVFDHFILLPADWEPS